MNLEKVKGILEDLIYDYVFEKRVATTEEIKAIEKVLIEIDRLQKENYEMKCAIKDFQDEIRAMP